MKKLTTNQIEKVTRKIQEASFRLYDAPAEKKFYFVGYYTAAIKELTDAILYGISSYTTFENFIKGFDFEKQTEEAA